MNKITILLPPSVILSGRPLTSSSGPFFNVFKKKNIKVQITHRKNPAENYDISFHRMKVHG